MAERIDTLNNGYKIIQNDKAFCFGVDAVLLADFCNIHNKRLSQTVYDLGTGNGILPLLLHGKLKKENPDATTPNKFIGLEVQSAAADMAHRSVELNGLQKEVQVVEGNLKDVKTLFSSQSADFVISNPPYMTVEQSHENSSDEKSIARHEVLCSLDDVIRAAAFLLKSNGAFYIIHRPYRLSEIISAMEKYKLTPRRMKLVFPKIDQAPEMVLIEARPNYKPDLKIEPPLIMYDRDGYTEKMQSILNNI